MAYEQGAAGDLLIEKVDYSARRCTTQLASRFV